MQYIKTQSILFLYGLFDSIQFMKGLRRYAFDKQDKYCIEIQKYLKQAIQFAAKKLATIIFIDFIVYLLSLLSIPKLFLMLIQIISVVFYLENNIRQLVYVGKITQTAIQYETNVKQNRQFLIYNLKRDNNVGFSTLIDQVKLTLQALLFSFLLLLQTSLFDILVIILPENTLIQLIIKHLDYLLYAVFITTGYLSLKIPYQDHLPYYLHTYIGYLIGYSVILSYFLNVYFSFPKLGIVFSILSPICLLREFQIDAPLITEIEEKSFRENLGILIKNFLGEEVISRTSYEHHLKMAENDKEYKLKLRKTIGWFTLARGLRPYVINPLNKAIIIFMKTYNSLIGVV
ncbi:unnamed protein product (macronuclear) [Paramecium tetraurelia]|uniref:ABC transmembrane type-1 domain-containing protein n=1 Tax=Paramecium tetraurelia TaxID=5888 RepID=A0E0C1_PARTE|nr:uncharacterized protein GSPATT00021906001 [Paramecium tetraurelia]CAK88738.1 unnamed protein product [Paramecium tetraurelia]|eukprot:XP_001456135.1 hypothetical protein (macronuclear) [Paramecium tetraurelia strain d4-2]